MQSRSPRKGSELVASWSASGPPTPIHHFGRAARTAHISVEKNSAEVQAELEFGSLVLQAENSKCFFSLFVGFFSLTLTEKCSTIGYEMIKIQGFSI